MRLERDTMGEVEISDAALYGPATARAVEIFPISGRCLPRPFLRALGLVKEAAARANAELGLLDPDLADDIRRAAREVAEGAHDSHFPVDVFQTGSGTSTNMNANEVIANLVCRMRGLPLGRRDVVHPNDHVNRSQSTNDVMPTALHVALATEVGERLLPAIEELERELLGKARAFRDVVKVGRTHLQDATPVALGQVFGGYAAQVSRGRDRIRAAVPRLLELAVGGTAVGTGLNCPAGFAPRVVELLREETGLDFAETGDHFEAQSARDASVELSGALKTVAVSLLRIANDIRHLASGPRCGIGEIRLPAVQPGSSIMPGKVNPVIPEILAQVAMRVVGNDTAVTLGGASGVFELNATIPLVADALLESIAILGNGCRVMAERCVAGIRADEERCAELCGRSLMLVTALAPVVGYEEAARIAEEARRRGTTIREVAEETRIPDLERLLDPARMIGDARS
jgi:fumarate hydratase class II